MKILATLILSAAALFPLTSHADDTPVVAEIFACSLNEGKTWEDWEKVNANFAATVRKIGGAADDFNAFVWRPFRSSVDFDYLWNGYFANLATWGRSMQDYEDSELGDAADDAWEELETCNSALLYTEQIYDSPSFPPANQPLTSSVIESFLCQLNPGKKLDDVRTIIDDAWRPHIASLDLPVDIFMRTPAVSGRADVTHSYFAVHQDFAAYGQTVSTYQTDPGQAAVQAQLDDVQTCTNALWQGQRVFSQEQ